MARLILTLDGAVIREYELDKDSISIGRKHGNDVQLNDLTVSGRHALITRMGDHIYVDDLGSTNGTLLNGGRVAKSQIQHGDTIQTGNYQFTYFSEEDGDYEPTMFIRAEIEDTQVIDTSSVSINTRGEKLAGVRIMNGPMAKKVLELRKPFNTLGFNGDKLAMISRNVNGYTISAILNNKPGKPKSSDKPLVNKTPIPSDPMVLNDRDVLELAGTKMEFFYLY
ncbi:MAG: FHA domain-containing protein [Gammaproteobacteria bacterium]|nr:FHA domain-containing protein [Gammaproteobacteria bacterium]